MMPGMDGFEVARRLKAGPETAHIPIVFMTGLTETEHVVAAFDAGGVDYVTKPIRPREVLARMAAHMQRRAQARQARNALDAFGHATLVVRLDDGRGAGVADGAGPQLLPSYFGTEPAEVPALLMDWLRAAADGREARAAGQRARSRRLVCTLQGRTGDDDWLVVLREQRRRHRRGDHAGAPAHAARDRGAVLGGKGKTNRDIGDILGTSPATVNKHLEHVFEKLGVETRTAAAGAGHAARAGIAACLNRTRAGPMRSLPRLALLVDGDRGPGAVVIWMRWS